MEHFNIEVWHYLVAGAFVALIIEIFTISFVAGSVGVGLLLAALANYLGFAIQWQIVWFAVGVGVTFFTIRAIMEKFVFKKNGVKTNQDALIGKTARVSEEIDPARGSGRVKIDGDDWKAETENDEIIGFGQLVEITDVRSIILIVKSK
ncbi:MAG: NfeD family protein [Bacteroidales bacterium]|nr:NfeD family protein [Bacteroidales bacterium]